MKTNIFIVLLILVFISFLVPKLPEGTIPSTEKLTMYRINAAGDRLLVRTTQHDYEFVLPPNLIGEVVKYAPVATGLGYWWLEDLNVLQSGKTSTELNSLYGPGVYGMPFPPGSVARLKALGYTSTGEMEEADKYLQMSLSIKLLNGQQYAAGAKGDFAGADLTSMSHDSISVHTLNDGHAKNRKINWLLLPFTAIKNAGEVCLLVLMLLFTGFRPGA